MLLQSGGSWSGSRLKDFTSLSGKTQMVGAPQYSVPTHGSLSGWTSSRWLEVDFLCPCSHLSPHDDCHLSISMFGEYTPSPTLQDAFRCAFPAFSHDGPGFRSEAPSFSFLRLKTLLGLSAANHVSPESHYDGDSGSQVVERKPWEL